MTKLRARLAVRDAMTVRREVLVAERGRPVGISAAIPFKTALKDVAGVSRRVSGPTEQPETADLRRIGALGRRALIQNGTRRDGIAGGPDWIVCPAQARSWRVGAGFPPSPPRLRRPATLGTIEAAAVAALP